MKKKTVLASSLLVLFLAGFAVAQATGTQSAIDAICTVLENIRVLLYAIAAGVAIVVITLQGIKWAGSAEDPGARKQAKQGIIHAVVGLVIVLLAVWIVLMVFGQNCG
jgi:type IV secretory pathway VirB2 component (pilin)